MLTINSSKISAKSKGIAVSRIFSIHKLPFMASQKKKKNTQDGKSNVNCVTESLREKATKVISSHMLT